jgi:hypothetical protein
MILLMEILLVMSMRYIYIATYTLVPYSGQGKWTAKKTLNIYPSCTFTLTKPFSLWTTCHKMTCIKEAIRGLGGQH